MNNYIVDLQEMWLNVGGAVGRQRSLFWKQYQDRTELVVYQSGFGREFSRVSKRFSAAHSIHGFPMLVLAERAVKWLEEQGPALGLATPQPRIGGEQRDETRRMPPHRAALLRW